MQKTEVCYFIDNMHQTASGVMRSVMHQEQGYNYYNGQCVIALPRTSHFYKNADDPVAMIKDIANEGGLNKGKNINAAFITGMDKRWPSEAAMTYALYDVYVDFSLSGKDRFQGIELARDTAVKKISYEGEAFRYALNNNKYMPADQRDDLEALERFGGMICDLDGKQIDSICSDSPNGKNDIVTCINWGMSCAIRGGIAHKADKKVPLLYETFANNKFTGLVATTDKLNGCGTARAHLPYTQVMKPSCFMNQIQMGTYLKKERPRYTLDQMKEAADFLNTHGYCPRTAAPVVRNTQYSVLT